MRESCVGLDIEGNGFFRYPERVCLVQMSIKDRPYLIDPLQIDCLLPLKQVFLDPGTVKILHAGDYDVRSLDRDFDFQFRNIFDTSIAASFVGSKRLGLDAVLKEYLGVEVTKSKKLQRSDWTIRPLSKEAQSYAADDVRYLVKARKSLSKKLKSLGRLEWVAEECERLASLRFVPRDEDTAFLRVKGCGNLDGKSLAVLKNLYELREDEAIGRDRPPFKIVSDGVLVTIAENPKGDHRKVKGIGKWGNSDMLGRIRSLVEDGLKEDPVVLPKRKSSGRFHLSHSERELAKLRLKKLKQWRISIAEDLKVEASLLWPLISLNRISQTPGSIDQEFEMKEIRRWQVKEFGDDLRRTVTSLNE